VSFTFERFEVTEAEAEVVKRLLRLYHAAEEIPTGFCEAFDEAYEELGEINATTFASLEDKVRRIV
jgi:hypothetical protein